MCVCVYIIISTILRSDALNALHASDHTIDEIIAMHPNNIQLGISLGKYISMSGPQIQVFPKLSQS